MIHLTRSIVGVAMHGGDDEARVQTTYTLRSGFLEGTTDVIPNKLCSRKRLLDLRKKSQRILRPILEISISVLKIKINVLFAAFYDIASQK